MKTIDLIRFGSALCLLAVPASVAGAQSVTDPAPIISAFNETCRRGFPNLDTIRQHSESVGWVRRSARLIAGNPTVAMPDFFGKDGMMLTLSAPNRLSNRSSCGIAVSGPKTMEIGALAAAVSVALDGAQPSHAKVKGAEEAVWQLKSGLIVRASVSKPGRFRTINLVVLTS